MPCDMNMRGGESGKRRSVVVVMDGDDEDLALRHGVRHRRPKSSRGQVAGARNSKLTIVLRDVHYSTRLLQLSLSVPDEGYMVS